MYVQANKDMHLKEPFGPTGPPCVPMPYKWMATPQPGARAQGIGYHASSLSAPVPHASPDQLGPGAVHPFGAPAQAGSAGGSAAHGPSVHPDAQPLPGGNLPAVNGAAPLPYHPHQLQSLPPQQLLLPMAPPLAYLPGGMPPPLHFMPPPPGSMGPMAPPMPLGAMPPPHLGMPLPPMHRPYPGLEVW